MTGPTRRALMALLLALPAWARALDFGFKAPHDPDDPAAVGVMRDLAQRIVPVYQAADTDAYLANLTALQIVSGAYGAAFDSSKLLRSRYKTKPFDALAERAVLDGLYARARQIEARDRIDFATAYARSFRELMPALDDAQAAAVMTRLQLAPAQFREPVQQAFDRWRAKGSIPQAEAVALVRDWLAYESRRSFAVLLPALVAAETDRRYLVEAGVQIPVRRGVVIHANLVRPGAKAGKGRLPEASARSLPRGPEPATSSRCCRTRGFLDGRRARSRRRHRSAPSRPPEALRCGDCRGLPS